MITQAFVLRREPRIRQEETESQLMKHQTWERDSREQVQRDSEKVTLMKWKVSDRCQVVTIATEHQKKKKKLSDDDETNTG